eukprot:PITA_13477
MLPSLNATFIALIPKEENNQSPEKSRPIALSNVLYKILSKVIATCLKPLLPLLISPKKSGYVEGRQITNGIILTHEIIHSLKQTKKADASSACINKSKSQVFFFHTPPITQASIARILGFSIASLPSKYLGAPMTASALKHSSWKILLEKLEAHISSWTFRALNMASRLVLIKAVLQSMPLYLFTVLAAPKWVLKAIKNLQQDFLWGNTKQKIKSALVKWETVCHPKSSGGTRL